MDELQKKYRDYMEIRGYTFEYHLIDEQVIRFKIGDYDLPHMLGLHKLIDIPILAEFSNKRKKNISAKFIMQQMGKKDSGILTHQDIIQSKFFKDIQDRYQYFNKENIFSMAYNEIIIDFDKSKIKTILKANYILVDNNLHLFLVKSIDDQCYIESFFYNNTKLYTKNQIKLKVKKIIIYNKNGHKYFEDIL